MTGTAAFRVRPAKAPLVGRLPVPGDKSISHRALLFSALSEGACSIRGLSLGEDNGRTRRAFEQMGATWAPLGPGIIEVRGVGLDGLRSPSEAIDCGNSGTTLRLLAGLLSGQKFSATLDGDASLRKRPMARVAQPLGRMGARIQGAPGQRQEEVYPPLSIQGTRPLDGLTYAMPVASAQVKSALLLAGLYAQGPVELDEPGPSRDHTERMMQALGVPLRTKSRHLRLDPRGWNRVLPARSWTVPGDISSAAFLLVAALLVPGSRVTLEGVGINPTRTGLLDALEQMGGQIRIENSRQEGGEPVADLTALAGPLRGIHLRGDLVVRAIDEIPILCVAAAFAQGTTEISDAQELRVKESDRIAAICRELGRLGARVEERPDGLRIEGSPALAGGVECESSGDHRIAMACAVAALVAREETRITDVGNVATSFPSFRESLAQLGAEITEAEQP